LHTQTIKIENWLINIHENTATHPDRGTFKLKNKSVAVLIELANANGEIVSKQQLLESVWPDIVVTENSLTQAISEIRKVLGDTKQAPKFIQTFPNQGYRLSLVTHEVPKESRFRFDTRLVYLMLFAAILIIAVGIYLSNTQSGSQRISSPDGQWSASITSKSDSAELSFIVIEHDNINDMYFRSLEITSPDSFSWSVDSKHFIAGIPSTDNFHHFVIATVGSLDKQSFKVSKNLSEHSQIKLDPTPKNATPLFVLKGHHQISKRLHKIVLANGQQIHIKFDENGVRNINWLN
tara:strand:- start:43 stop:921 length:879 start_codon:yes stop_codon:yes gene_type:complete